MQKDDIWDTQIFNTSPIIKQLLPLTDYFKDFSEWPTLQDYKALFKLKKLSLTPVSQSNEVLNFEDKYESRIYLKNELQTRLHNWHDFFNAIVWLQFPKTKKILNQLHFQSSANRSSGSNRSVLENRITQFDECGAIIVTSNKKLLSLVENHDWNELFITQRQAFLEQISCVVFGHAMFEKAQTPYIGMTCYCLLIDDKELLNEVQAFNYSNLDVLVANIWSNQIFHNPVKFKAFPILGIPSFWPNQDDEFYKNTDYFR